MGVRRARWRVGWVGSVIAGSAGLVGASPGEGRVPPAPGPACQAQPAPADAAAVAAFLEALKRRPAPPAANGEAVVPLDNRGHNYGPATLPLADPPAPEER